MPNLPYKVCSHYSPLRGFSKIDKLVGKAHKLKLPAIALTDYNSLAGCVEFLKEITKANKKTEHKVKPVLGITLRVIDYQCDITMLARNLAGYYHLVHLLGKCHYHNGEYGILCKEIRGCDDAILINHPALRGMLDSYEHLYEDGKDVQGSSIYYCNPEDRIYQQILTCSLSGTDIKSIKEFAAKYPEKAGSFYNQFWGDGKYHLDEESISKIDSKDIYDLIDIYDIANPPQLPLLKGVDDPDKKLTELCREGWMKREINKKCEGNPSLRDVYIKRIKEELETFKLARIAAYMLIIRDFIQYARNNRVKVGLRGSAVGCLVSFLVGISDIDPVICDPILGYSPTRELLFSRFLNKGRIVDGGVTGVDIDVDVAISFREKLIQYFKTTYGADHISYIITYARFDGAGAIKEIFRVMQPCFNYDEVANQITRNMLDTAKVQDVLEDLRQENPDYNIVQYNMDHVPELKEFIEEFPEMFELAVGIAGTISHASRHAAGVIIGREPLKQRFPIHHDAKTGEPILGYEMEDAEYVGAVKYDILGVAALEKLAIIENMIENGLTEPVNIYITE